MTAKRMLDREINEEFHRIVEVLRTQGDLDCIEDIIPDKIKRDFVEDWHDN